MEQLKLPCIHYLCFLLISIFSIHATCENTLQTYIVHVSPKPDIPLSIFTTEKEIQKEREEYYKTFLPTRIANSKEPRIVYSYHNVISGFAARLTKHDLIEMEKKPGFLQAYLEKYIPLLTTHTPKFLGLNQHKPGFWNDSNLGKGVIIGVLDTGILPYLPSFNDGGVIPPPPSKWKGVCEFGPVVCNNKIIGARNFIESPFNSEIPPPYDELGHGTHTASTAAGMFVNDVEIEGQAKGMAVGMSPYAHLAIYKVCDEYGCTDSRILAAMDAAIADGVDIMSLSLGGVSQPYYSDSIAIGALAATEKGIFVSCAAGNSGPYAATLSNEAPWILTVGASTIDRKIQTTVKLGNGQEFHGESIYQLPENYPSPALPLIFPGSVNSSASTCYPDSLDGIHVQNKIVVCDVGELNRVQKGSVVAGAGGAAMILTNTKAEGYVTFADVHILPASHVSYADARKIKSYIKSTLNPKASISYDGTIIDSSILAPVVSHFSSRGPSQADSNILKPDIIGPGVNILAAWPYKIGTSQADYNIISGTSMATPHLSGIAALLKNVHPDWSPAAIKSAIMTTAITDTDNGTLILNESHNHAGYFAMGAGHVNPTSAADPGLIYNSGTDDYIPYLCGLYSNEQVSAVIRSSVNCSKFKPISGAELNYPSFMVFLGMKSVKVTRTVTNVGQPRSRYSVNLNTPNGTSIIVEPKILVFSEANEKASYTVTFTSNGIATGVYTKGSLTWISSDKKYKVNSPIMVAHDSSSAQAM